ncbi:MAG TPA: HAD family hydrolase, partial [Verrucomicrobiota bacterium]|nr:HAD family hydrolase [Verrucomicrobiota bacterium]
MKLRAAIFDVYGTLLEVGPPPPDGHALWEQLFHDTFNTSPPISRLDFSVACNRAITQRHDAAKARGVAFPEINWPSVVEEVIPAVSKLSREARDEFIFRQVQIGRSLKLFAGVGHGLRLLQQKGCALGIASNAQHYTLRELSEALSGDRVDLSVFDPDLCVW